MAASSFGSFAMLSLLTDSRTTRQSFHTVGNNLSYLHYLLGQPRVGRDVSLNAISIGLQFSPQRLQLTDETVKFTYRNF